MNEGPSSEALAEQLEDANEARRARFQQAEQVTRFRSLLERGPEDQVEAARRGYHSVEQLAIDELGRAYRDLYDRVTHLEAHVVEEARVVDDLGKAS